MRKTAVLTILFIVMLVNGAGAFTGLALPFYDESVINLDSLNAMIDHGHYDDAAVGLAFYILFNPDEKGVSQAFSLLGMSLLRAHKGAQAAEAFAMAANGNPLMADINALYRIRALQQAGMAEEALAALDHFRNYFPDSKYTFTIEETRPLLLKMAGRHEDAAKAFLKKAGNESGTLEYKKYRFAAAECLRDAGKIDQSKIALQEIILHAPAGRFTEEALSLYADLNEGHYTAAMHQQGLDWEKEGKYRAAVPLIRDLIEARKKSGQTDAQLRWLEAMLAYAEFSIHDNEESLELYRKLAKDRSDTERAHYLYRQAKILTRMGDNKGSRAVFEQLIEQHPSSGYAPASRYQIALIDMEDNDYKSSYNYFKWRITKPGGQQEYLLWLTAWNAYRIEYKDTALDLLDQLIKKYRRSRDYDRYVFWKARILLEKKQDTQAAALFSSLNSNAPLSYYGIKSFEELKKLKQSGRDPVEVLTKKRPGNGKMPEFSESMLTAEERSRLSVVRDLAHLGMTDEAQQELAVIVSAYEDEKQKDRLILFGLSQLYQQTHAYYSAMNLARKGGLYYYSKKFSNPLAESYFSFVYPRGYPHWVEPLARERKLPPELVYALIYTESWYRPKVVSPANAIGLMQIIPQTGNEIAGDLNVENFQIEDLYDPQTNLTFGTHYLRKMVNHFNGRLPCAIASYNAGPRVVGKWVRNKGNLSDELFIEEIPYQETNRYVKKVTTAMMIYKAMYDL